MEVLKTIFGFSLLILICLGFIGLILQALDINVFKDNENQDEDEENDFNETNENGNDEIHIKITITSSTKKSN